MTEKGLKLCIYGSPNTHSLMKRSADPLVTTKNHTIISVNLDQKGPEIMHIFSSQNTEFSYATYGKVLGQTSDKIHSSNPCVFSVYTGNAAFKSIILLSSFC